MKQWELRGVTVDRGGVARAPSSIPPSSSTRGHPAVGVASRLCSGAGLARLRAEARLIRRHPHEYRRLLPVKGHVAAVQSLVRAHPRQYNGFLLEAVIEHDRLFGRGSASNSGSASGGPAMAGVAARAR